MQDLVDSAAQFSLEEWLLHEMYTVFQHAPAGDHIGCIS
jgi:hypothetical protein